MVANASVKDDTGVMTEVESNSLPILPLKGMVVFPYVIAPLMISNQKYALMVDEALMAGRTIGLVAQKEGEREDPGQDDIYSVGTSATILKMLRFPDGSVRFLVQGLARFEITKFKETSPQLIAEIRVLDEHTHEGVQVEALTRNVLDLLKRVVDLAPSLSEEVFISALNQDGPSKLADYIATNLNISVGQRQGLLEILNVK